MKDFFLSVIIPAYNEEAVLTQTIGRLTSVMEREEYHYELIFVNDGSKDATLCLLEEASAKDSRIKYLSFSRNFGHQAAVSAGIDACSGDAVVIIDADLQDPPEVIPQMVALWQDGNDVVYGKRKSRDGESFFKTFTAKAFYRILNSLSTVDIPLDTGDFRLIDRKVADVLRGLPEKNRFLRGLVSWIGFQQAPCEFSRDARAAGETKYTMKKMINLAIDGILSFSSAPLRLMAKFGFLIVFISVALFIYTIVSLCLGSTAAGWASLMTVITFFGGTNFVAIGLLGEYVARIYDEAKGRPNYIIDKRGNFKDE
ncbi:MAG: glycosyltransferase family 2 protein [Clostridia bacterium]|nr:glycosyltransferase family 2 protein [Clostridia bacterium]MBQ4624872.1 glycosyltransferase family 2 protein [Clostridia bacterium]